MIVQQEITVPELSAGPEACKAGTSECCQSDGDCGCWQAVPALRTGSGARSDPVTDLPMDARAIEFVQQLVIVAGVDFDREVGGGE